MFQFKTIARPLSLLSTLSLLMIAPVNADVVKDNLSHIKQQIKENKQQYHPFHLTKQAQQGYKENKSKRNRAKIGFASILEAYTIIPNSIVYGGASINAKARLDKYKKAKHRFKKIREHDEAFYNDVESSLAKIEKGGQTGGVAPYFLYKVAKDAEKISKKSSKTKDHYLSGLNTTIQRENEFEKQRAQRKSKGHRGLGGALEFGADILVAIGSVIGAVL